ncbi:PLP-dependent aminotransferase family protein [Neorhizobium alkalisoli]|uniref:GntR family transcriptional regulator n=1 Tax=Neorhizobium alkalisoli TaxID=528178 RepID=A0A561Q810_9HYPH|nr:PLP-dependent aminotransferase family protein [Neorhizobium alkalisoli]TWF46480.1 GntR family transcriptional regulator [Neorhizobium alkalisoli]
MWKARIIGGGRLKYIGLADALEQDIQTGIIAAGDRLPPQRSIAEALGVDLTTVTRGFNEAHRRGLIEAQIGRGTFVRDYSSARSSKIRPAALDLSMNIPCQPASVDFQQLLPKGIAAVLANGKGLMNLHYQDSAGAEPDRQAATQWLKQRIENADFDRIVVAAGAQSALFSICELLLSRGDVIAAGEFTYPGLKAVAAQMRVEIDPIAMDDEGLLPDDFERSCRIRPPKLLYVIPNIDNPTATTMPEPRRAALVEIARRYGVAIVEDDPYGLLLEAPGRAFADLMPEATWHISTLSKCATPALRVAYILVPKAADALQLASVTRAMMLMAPPLMSALASSWIMDGTLAAITAAIRREARARQMLASSLLSTFDRSANMSGHHLWLRLPSGQRADDLVEAALRRGVLIVPSSAFAVGKFTTEAVRISLGVASDRSELEDGLNQLASLVAQPATLARAIV